MIGQNDKLLKQKNSYKFPKIIKQSILDKYQFGEGVANNVKKCVRKIDNKEMIVKAIVNFIANDVKYENLNVSVIGLPSQVVLMQAIKGNHQHLVQYFQCIKDQQNSKNNQHSNLYIFMEKCDCSLKDYLVDKTISQRQAIQYLIQLIKGYEVLQSMNIMHRDIKPSNLLLKNGKLKIADFGLSKQYLFDKAILQSNTGTMNYKCPQMLAGQKYTSLCDIWSIGATFYEILNGRQPWDLQKSSEFHTKVYLDKVKQIDKLQFKPELSKQIRDFIKGCLKYSQQDRLTLEKIKEHQIFRNHFKRCELLFIMRSQIIHSKFDLQATLARLKQALEKDYLTLQQAQLLLSKIKKIDKPTTTMILNKHGIKLNNKKFILLSVIRKLLTVNEEENSLYLEDKIKQQIQALNKEFIDANSNI